MFSIGQWAIDTKKQICVTVAHELSENLYVLQTDEDDYYIQDISNLIEYDKYYFDRKGEKNEKTQ